MTGKKQDFIDYGVQELNDGIDRRGFLSAWHGLARAWCGP